MAKRKEPKSHNAKLMEEFFEDIGGPILRAFREAANNGSISSFSVMLGDVDGKLIKTRILVIPETIDDTLWKLVPGRETEGGNDGE
jgi:hypothetical protein